MTKFIQKIEDVLKIGKYNIYVRTELTEEYSHFKDKLKQYYYLQRSATMISSSNQTSLDLFIMIHNGPFIDEPFRFFNLPSDKQVEEKHLEIVNKTKKYSEKDITETLRKIATSHPFTRAFEEFLIKYPEKD